MKVKLLPIILAVVMLVPIVVSAQASASNPCAGAGSNFGACISRIYIWSLGISGILALAMSVFGGYQIMTARGNGAQVSKGKSYIISSLVGMVLLMCAYLLLNTINPDLLNFNPSGVEFNTPITQNPSTGGSGGATGGTGGGSGAGSGAPATGTASGCQSCVTLTSSSVPIKSSNACAPGYGECQIESGTAQKLQTLASSVSGWQVTEAWPPTGYSDTRPNGIHQNSCHGNATCVDANFISSGDATSSNISNFIIKAQAAGLRAVYEVKTQTEKDNLVANNVPVANVQVVSHITATHFSVYNP